MGQVAQTLLDLKLWENLSSPLTFKYISISPVSWLLGFLSLILVVIINEIVKLHEIRYGSSREDVDKGLDPYCSLVLSCREIIHREQVGNKKEKVIVLCKSPGCRVQAHVPALREKVQRKKEGQKRAGTLRQKFLIAHQ